MLEWTSLYHAAMHNDDTEARSTLVKRQRRPAFDREQGVATALRLFHARGYDAVSVADLTQALDINAPSLYAAYGSKFALFERAMRLYVATQMLPLDDFFAPGRAPAQALTDVLVAAARLYTGDPERLGCMVTEAMQADDAQARALAGELAKPATALLRQYIAAHAPKKDVQRLTDYMLFNLRGLSSGACLKNSQKQLVDCARTVGRALDAEFKAG
jgi:TetR/AcrR family transcriptional repressor for divergent bdcA